MSAVFAKKDKMVWLQLVLLVITVCIAYSKIFHAGFIAWDDNEYVVHNKDIKEFAGQNISAWFSRFYIGNYHPFTMASYAIDHLLGGDDPFAYHFTNLLLHTCNALFLYVLLARLQANKWMAFFVAALFALHPAQTESISWVAERKTVLCAFFYLLALLQYTAYVKRPSVKSFLFVSLLGIAAMLSKAVGVALPLSLIAMDIWLQRDIKTLRPWIEKAPLIVVALVVGIVAIKAQAAGKFLGLHPEYGITDTIVFAGYAYVQYIVHFFVPVGLSVIYPYPEKTGLLQYLYLLVAAGIVALAFVAYRKKWYVLCGGICFYTVNIVLLLQFVQFGEFLMADRYLYIAGIGIIFPAVYYLFAWLQKMSRPAIAIGVVAVASLSCLSATYLRNDIWLSDFNFFSAILEAFPNSAVAQYSVGGLYTRMGEYAEAEKHIGLAVQLDPNNYKAWYDKGALYLRENKTAESLEALNRCLAIKEYTKAYFSRAILYQQINKPNAALPDIEKVLAEEPQNAKAYFVKADCLQQQGNAPAALENYSKAINYDGQSPLFYMRRGLLYAKTRQNDAALKDMDMAIGLDPASGELVYFRGIVKYHAGLPPCDDFKAALGLGYQQAQEAIAQACNH